MNGESGLTFDGTNLKVIAAGNTTTGGNIQLGITTDDTAKYTAITAQQHDSGTETEGFTLIGGNSAANDSNLVNIGGGFGEQNPATALRFFTGSAATREGTLRATIDSSGNVGIGKTPNRSRKLEVAGNINLDNGGSLEWEDGGVGIAGSGATDVMTFATAGAERMRITNAGYLQIGAASGDTMLNVHQSAQNWTTSFSNTSAQPYGMVMSFTAAAPNNTTNKFFKYIMFNIYIFFIHFNLILSLSFFKNITYYIK